MRRLASEVILELEDRIAHLERQARIIYDPNPATVEFHVQEGRGFARFYVGGKLTHLVTDSSRPIEEHFKKCFIKSFCEKNYLHDITLPHYIYDGLYDLFAGVMDEVDFFEVLTRVRMGELALQINCDQDQEWLRKISAKIKETDKEDPDYFYNMDLDYWVSDPSMVEGFTVAGVCDKALKETISHFTSKYGQKKKFDPSTYRLASTNKVAGHLVLATGVNVLQLHEALEDTDGVEDVEMDDGVLTFLMDKFENKNIEKQIKALARKHKVKFEKGEMTDGLGMIHTSSRRRASRRRG